MEKYLIVDIGNSSISFAIFSNEKIEHRYDVISDETHVAHIKELLASFIKDKKINKTEVVDGLICSVVPHFSVSIKKAIKDVFGVDVKIMDYHYYEDMEMIVDDKKQVGGDLVADVKATLILHKCPAIVVDLGTIAKYLLINENKVFAGVSFIPGINASLNAMRSSTALLPGIELNKKPAKLVGNTTNEALECGVFYGTLHTIKGYVEELEKQFKQPVTKVLTGGNSGLFVSYLDGFIYDPDYVLKGVYFLFKENRGS